jgi:hypothetical protein
MIAERERRASHLEEPSDMRGAEMSKVKRDPAVVSGARANLRWANRQQQQAPRSGLIRIQSAVGSISVLDVIEFSAQIR